MDYPGSVSGRKISQRGIRPANRTDRNGHYIRSHSSAVRKRNSGSRSWYGSKILVECGRLVPVDFHKLIPGKRRNGVESCSPDFND
ncbi:hypothetical protein D3C86_1602190 [compost metagenome]